MSLVPLVVPNGLVVPEYPKGSKAQAGRSKDDESCDFDF